MWSSLYTSGNLASYFLISMQTHSAKYATNFYMVYIVYNFYNIYMQQNNIIGYKYPPLIVAQNLVRYLDFVTLFQLCVCHVTNNRHYLNGLKLL